MQAAGSSTVMVTMKQCGVTSQKTILMVIAMVTINFPIQMSDLVKALEEKEGDFITMLEWIFWKHLCFNQAWSMVESYVGSRTWQVSYQEISLDCEKCTYKATLVFGMDLQSYN